jgi:hypothetical protein
MAESLVKPYQDEPAQADAIFRRVPGFETLLFDQLL